MQTHLQTRTNLMIRELNNNNPAKARQIMDGLRLAQTAARAVRLGITTEEDARALVLEDPDYIAFADFSFEAFKATQAEAIAGQ